MFEQIRPSTTPLQTCISSQDSSIVKNNIETFQDDQPEQGRICSSPMEISTIPDKIDTSVMPDNIIKSDNTVQITQNLGSNLNENDVINPEPIVTAISNTIQTLSDENLFKSGELFELSRYSWTNNKDTQQYIRGCLWSPDGTCVLTAVNSDGMHVIELPRSLYEENQVSTTRPLDVLQSAIHVKEGGIVYDYCWYPFMNSEKPETCCWIASRQHEPIHMWDAFTGELRCSYRGYDSVDEIEPAISVIFSNDGSKIYGGYKKGIKIFNTDLPGREYEEIKTKHPNSCFAINENHPGLIVSGSWNSTINLFDLRVVQLGSLATFSEHTGGITYLKFDNDGNYLFSGARKDNAIFKWDMRNFSSPVTSYTRNVHTNQRIYFDLSAEGLWLASGDTTGIVHIWHTENEKRNYKFPVHNDCCNGVAFHPTLPILSTTSGQYHFIDDDNAGKEISKVYENSLIFWWTGDVSYN